MQTNKSWFLIPLRRFLSAIIDASLVALICFYALQYLGMDFEKFNWLVVFAVFMALWTIWDYLLTALFGSTLGRWLFRIALQKPDGNKLDLATELKSGLAVWSILLGFGLPWIQIVTMLGNYLYYLKNGVWLFDKLAGVEMALTK